MKTTYTKILARQIVISLLAFTIILAVVALYVRNSITSKLEHTSRVANSSGTGNEQKAENILLLLNQAEDNFQASLLNAANKSNAVYKTQLSLAFTQIDSLLKSKADTSQLTAAQSLKVKLLYQKKMLLSTKLVRLKHNFDSLLSAYAVYNDEAAKSLPAYSAKVHKITREIATSVDTIKKEADIKKKGLFGRLGDAISNKNAAAKDVLEIQNSNQTKIIDQTIQQAAAQNKKDYTKRIKQLEARNESLLTMQRQLIALNTRINNELQSIVNNIKDIDIGIANEIRMLAFQNYHETSATLNQFYLAALFMVMLFAALLIIFLIQLNRSELELCKENERSVTIAQQKMNLLLHMSHEIRNPLTAIKGFLDIFSRTSLAEKQVDMLDSIKLSSDMLLRTLNDTLDAAKMETSQFKINQESFNPDFTLKAVIESMRFGATKKNLQLAYNFKGDKNLVLIGDSFRLNQVMVNLLSNAIKYTATGGVNITAVWIANENKLQVEVSDTGAGISEEQQANLFAKYYQTNSAKGHTGTGLGLFICQQLIKLQGGKISVKSKVDAGTTFKFYIPYAKGDAKVVAKQSVDDAGLLLNGISVLAVDDNEINLQLLKMIMDKWNVTFYEAANGIEALEVLKNQPITLVITDIHMPEMDGNELLYSIQNLDGPLSQLPVIVMSGSTEPNSKEKYLQMGFAGMIGKPYTKAELLDQIVSALNITAFSS